MIAAIAGRRPAGRHSAGRRIGAIRKTVYLYRKASTPEVIHRAVKTSWQSVTGGGVVGVGASTLLPVDGGILGKLLLTTLAAVGAGLASFWGNLLAEVDRLIAEQAES